MSQRATQARMAIVITCFVFFTITSFFLFLHYRPLARYPYGTEEQRTRMAQKLSADQIDYLINSQLTPDVIMPFLDCSNFNIENALYYTTAMNARATSPDGVVEFVNQFRDQFSYGQLEEYLRWYTYQDLSRFWQSGSDRALSGDPANLLLVLDETNTIFRWRPENLISQGPMILREDAMDAWNEMDYMAGQDGFVLSVYSTYISYDEAKNNGLEASSGQNIPYGSREEQLGSTVLLSLAATWDALKESVFLEDPGNYEKVLSLLAEDQRMLLRWLEDNAWKSGWIIRYPRPASNESGWPEWQPFLLRYVGEEYAAEIHDQRTILDEYSSIR